VSGLSPAAAAVDGPERAVKTTMFYDGGCPLCRREVAHYRAVDREGRVDWVDISQDAPALAAHGIEAAAAMQRLHALNAEGRLVTGVWAFMAVWQQLPGYRHLARLVGGLHLEPALEWGYRHFARWRWRRRGGAGEGRCGPRACGLP
jgi:predicted DCC family thiol-disulfide oxidoreductase YuxK